VDALRATLGRQVLDDHFGAATGILRFNRLLETVQRAAPAAVQHDVIASLCGLQRQVLTDAGRGAGYHTPFAAGATQEAEEQ